jgi:hypothetical protein
MEDCCLRNAAITHTRACNVLPWYHGQDEALMPTRAEVRARLAALCIEAPRNMCFDAVRSAIAENYLADPSNPYLQSGTTSGAARWTQTRHCIVDAVHRDGDFMDVGCANGLLLQDLIEWAAERGFSLRPHGINFVQSSSSSRAVDLLITRALLKWRTRFTAASSVRFRPSESRVLPATCLAGIYRISPQRRRSRRAADPVRVPQRR